MDFLNLHVKGRMARAVAGELRESSPHSVLGLSHEEIEQRIETAIVKSENYAIRSEADFRAFVELIFKIGPNFDEYPPFHAIFSESGTPADFLMTRLFKEAGEEDWVRAAVFDIVSRSTHQPEQEFFDTAYYLEAERKASRAISLVGLEPRHAEPFFLGALHPDVWRLADFDPMITPEEAQRFIENLPASPDKTGFAIIDSGSGFAGSIFVNRRGKMTDISYWVARPFWGQQIATTAITELIKLLRNENSLKWLSARIYRANLPSFRVLEKCGFKPSDDDAGGDILDFFFSL